MPRGKSGNSFQRGKSLGDLGRSGGAKNSRSRFLIVVEGITEHNYFDSLKRELKLSTVQVKLESAGGGSPANVVIEARNLWTESRNNYDYVVCVFDHDYKDQKYREALSKAKEYKFITITSIPSFEFWFLLHYEYTTSDFATLNDLNTKLEKQLINVGILKKGISYEDIKADKTLYTKLKPNQETAFNNALRLTKKHPNLDGCTNPSTKVHCLVKLLQRQKNFA